MKFVAKVIKLRFIQKYTEIRPKIDWGLFRMCRILHVSNLIRLGVALKTSCNVIEMSFVNCEYMY
jgi:hypothetical protein